jgi:hypothetical protein
MQVILSLFLLAGLSNVAAIPNVEIIGLGHSHVGGHLRRILNS